MRFDTKNVGHFALGLAENFERFDKNSTLKDKKGIDLFEVTAGSQVQQTVEAEEMGTSAVKCSNRSVVARISSKEMKHWSVSAD